MPSPTQVVPAGVEMADVGDVDDENSAVPDTLNMVVEEIDVVIDKADRVPRDDEDDEAGNNDPGGVRHD